MSANNMVHPTHIQLNVELRSHRVRVDSVMLANQSLHDRNVLGAWQNAYVCVLYLIYKYAFGLHTHPTCTWF